MGEFQRMKVIQYQSKSISQTGIEFELYKYGSWEVEWRDLSSIWFHLLLRSFYFDVHLLLFKYISFWARLCYPLYIIVMLPFHLEIEQNILLQERRRTIIANLISINFFFSFLSFRHDGLLVTQYISLTKV